MSGLSLNESEELKKAQREYNLRVSKAIERKIMKTFKVCALSCYTIVIADDVCLDAENILYFTKNRITIAQFRSWDYWFEVMD
jgi:hypothetical protein